MTMNSNQQEPGTNRPTGTPKDKWSAFLLCLLFGWLGVHQFYSGKFISGLIYLITTPLFAFLTFITGGLCGFLFILTVLSLIVDLIVILCKPNPYYT